MKKLAPFVAAFAAYRTPLMKSCLFHVAVLSLLLLSFSGAGQPPIVNRSDKVIHAVAVNSTEIDKQVEAIKAQQQKQQQAETARQKRAQAALSQAQVQKVQAEKDLAALKKQQQTAKQQLAKSTASAQKQLAALKVQQANEQKTLANLKTQQTALAEQQKSLAAEQAIKAKQAAERQQAAQAIEGEVNKYKGLIIEAISQQWLVPPNIGAQAHCLLNIRLAPDGSVLNVSVVQGSGNSLLDRSAVAAVYKASPLPVPNNSVAFNAFRQFNLTVRPKEYL